MSWNTAYNTHYNYRIVADSAANLSSLKVVPFVAVPMKIVGGNREFYDNEQLDVSDMANYLEDFVGKTTTSCPNPDDWLSAFGDAEYVFAVTVTGGLSCSNTAAEMAKVMYEDEHPERHVFVVDSLSAGPGEALLVEKLEELILSGMEYENICREIRLYQRNTGLLFLLSSLNNLAHSSRVSRADAKNIDNFNAFVVGESSKDGDFKKLITCRGFHKAASFLITFLECKSYQGGKILINHCFNESGANELKARILTKFPHAHIRVHQAGGLCSFYGERGGLMVGYEKG